MSAKPRDRSKRVLSWRVIGAAAVTGVLVLLWAWWMGPSLFGESSGTEDRRELDATVTAPAPCSDPNAEETVRFEWNGELHEGTLSGCGHDEDERVRIAVPADPAESEGPLSVSLAATAPGVSDLRRPVGLSLLLLSCVGGAAYAFLVARGPRLPAAAA